MKRNSAIRFIISLLFILAPKSVNADSNINKKLFSYTIDTIISNQINFIKQKSIEINTNLNSFKKIDKDISDESTEGGDIIKYYDGLEIKKITETFYGEMGKSNEEFYYHNGQLIFYYSVKENYNMPMYMKGSRVTSKVETRYYFLNNRIIKYLYNPIKNISDKEIYQLEISIVGKSKKALKK
jgi:hypothetical protein